MSTEMAMKFFSGELDLSKILSSIDDLENLQTQVKKMESKNNMSQFIKKK